MWLKSQGAECFLDILPKDNLISKATIRAAEGIDQALPMSKSLLLNLPRGGFFGGYNSVPAHQLISTCLSFPKEDEEEWSLGWGNS